MSNDNKQPVPSDTNSTNNSSLPPIFVEPDALPPMPNLDAKPQDIETPTVVSNDSGSAAPENDIKIDTVMPAVVTNSPKKKFAGGKVIATILGLFILVGGVGAGVFLTGQDQNIQEKASWEDRDRCQRLEFCKNSGCTKEYNSDCAEDVVTTSESASCQNVKAYSNTWTELTTAQLSALEVGDIINYCVTGTATSGTFTKAKFTINGELQAETTTQRPSSTDFCQQYTIPAGVTTFNVTGDIFHEVLGWR